MKFKLSLFVLLNATMLLAKDVIISVNELPKNAQEFISKNFKTIEVNLVKKDRDSYELILHDGTEIDFMINGEWKELDGKYKALPSSILPQIMKKVNDTWPDAQIFKISKEINGYKFKLDNNMKVYTDMQGNILRQKLDD